MNYFWLILLGLLSLAWLVCYFLTRKLDDEALFFWLAVVFAVWVGICIGELHAAGFLFYAGE